MGQGKLSVDPPVAHAGDYVRISCNVVNMDKKLRYYLKVAKSTTLDDLVFNTEIRSATETVSFSCPFGVPGPLNIAIEAYPDTRGKVLAKGRLDIHQTLTSIPLSPSVTQAGVSITLTTPPFFGFEQRVSFSREGGSKAWDYIAFLDNVGRIYWNWCTEVISSEIFIGKAPSRDSRGRILYFRDGGHFSKGILLAELKFEMHSPVTNFQVVPLRSQVQTKVSVDCEYAINPKSDYVIELRVDNVTLRKVPLSGVGYAKDISVELPFLAGWCEIACVTAEIVVASAQVLAIEDPNRTLPPTKITIVGPKEKSIRVFTNETFSVSYFGTTEAHVLLVTSIVLGKSYRPKAKAVASNCVVKKIGKCTDSETTSILSVENDGTYFVILGIEHDCGYQIVDAVKVSVAKQDTKSSTTKENSETTPISPNLEPPSAPTSAPLPPPSSSTLSPIPPLSPSAKENRGNVMCVVCWEKPRNVVVFACKHLCLCEECSVNLDKCPICNQFVVYKVTVYYS